MKYYIRNDGAEEVGAHLGNGSTANNGAPVFLPPSAGTAVYPLVYALTGDMLQGNRSICIIGEYNECEMKYYIYNDGVEGL